MDESPIKSHVFTLEELMRQVHIWRLKDDKIIFTNGCFDILHQGHVDILERAYELGDRTIVAINSDASVQSLEKAPNRPINSEHARAAVMSAVRFVDAVVIFNEPTPYELIKMIKPDVLVKGGDWKIDEIVGADIVQASGGEVLSLDLVEGFSTTGIIEKISNG